MLVETLRAALQQDSAVRDPATERLRSAETEPGFLTSLLDVVCAAETDAACQTMAVVLVKNAVARRWRPSASHGVSAEEKTRVRAQLLHLIDSVPAAAMRVLAVTIGRVARVDLPAGWPELFPALMARLQAGDASGAEALARGLLVLHRVLGELSSQRIPAGRKLYADVCQEVYPVLVRLFDVFSAQVVGDAPKHVDVVRLASKLLVRVLSTGAGRDDGAQPAARDVFALVLDRLEAMVADVRRQHAAFDARLASTMKTLASLFADLAQSDIAGLVKLDGEAQLFRRAIAFFSSVIEHMATDRAVVSVVEQFVVRACNFVKLVIKFGSNADDYPDAGVMHTGQAVHEQIGAQAVHLVALILGRILVLTPDDLAMWRDDPEEYVRESDDCSTELVRPAAENLFLGLVHAHRELVGTEIGRLTTAMLSDESQPVLARDAALQGMGLAAYDLYGLLDLGQWLATFVRDLEAHASDPEYRVIHRRVTWIVGCWASELPDAVKTSAYEFTVQALAAPSSDLVVRLTAVDALNALLEAWNFQPEEFAPVMPPAVNGLLQLAQAVQSPESILRVVSTLAAVLAAMDEAGAPWANSILTDYVVPMWSLASSSDLALVQSGLVRLAKRAVLTGGASAEALDRVVSPLVRHAIATSGDVSVYLLEDGLELLEAAAASMPVPGVASVVALCPPVVSVLVDQISTLTTCTSVLEAMVLVTGDPFVASHGGDLQRAVLAVLGNVKDAATLRFGDALDVILLAAPSAADALGAPVVRRLLELVLRADESRLAAQSYVSLLARIVLTRPAVFSATYAQAGDEQGALFERWMDLADGFPVPRLEKINALALLHLATAGAPGMRQHLGQLVNFCGSVHAQDVQDGMAINDRAAAQAATLAPAEPAEDEPAEPECAGTARLRVLDGDIVHRVTVVDALRQLRAAAGAADFDAAWQSQIGAEATPQLISLLSPALS